MIIEEYTREKQSFIEFSDLEEGDYFILAKDALDKEHGFAHDALIGRKIAIAKNPYHKGYEVNFINLSTEVPSAVLDYVKDDTEVYQIHIEKISITIDW